MHIATTIKTSHGPRLLPRPPMMRITVTPSELHALIRIIERDAAEGERELRFSAADHLACRAFGVACSGPMMRAKGVAALTSRHRVRRNIGRNCALLMLALAVWLRLAIGVG